MLDNTSIEQRKMKRKMREGVVVSNEMQKTVTVKVDRKIRHPRFEKVVIRGKRYYAHTEEEIAVGAQVVIAETRPLSKMKRWRVIEVVSSSTEKNK